MERKHIKLRVEDRGNDQCVFYIVEQEGISRGCGRIGEWEGIAFLSSVGPAWGGGSQILWLRGYDTTEDLNPVRAYREDMNRIEAAVRAFNAMHSGGSSSATDSPHIYEVE